MRIALLISTMLAAQAAAFAASVEIHPAGATVPENLLRIELRFTHPQRLPFDIHRVRLMDARGVPVTNAFLDLTLPSADARRITVLMNPGRVKTGVTPNVALGRALRAGDHVRLIVDDPERPGRSVSKTWAVTMAQTTGPRPAQWRVDPPRAHTRDALIVALRDPVSSTAQGLIAILDGSGRRVSGRSALTDGDARWRFVPDAPWRRGGHALVAHADVEDPAGNRACAAFEQAHASEIVCEADARIAFEAR